MLRAGAFGICLLASSLARAASPAVVQGLRVVPGSSQVRVEITLSSAVEATVTSATGPDRLVIELPNTTSEARQQRIAVNQSGVRAVRMGLNSAEPPVTRVVVDLDSPQPYSLQRDGNRIVLTIEASSAVTARRRGAPAPAASGGFGGIFRRREPAASAPVDDQNASLPPAPPPLTGPRWEPPSAQRGTAQTAQGAAPTAKHPNLGSLQQGTVFPGMPAPTSNAPPAASVPAPIPEVAVVSQLGKEAPKLAASASTPPQAVPAVIPPPPPVPARSAPSPLASAIVRTMPLPSPAPPAAPPASVPAPTSGTILSASANPLPPTPPPPPAIPPPAETPVITQATPAMKAAAPVAKAAAAVEPRAPKQEQTVTAETEPPNAAAPAAQASVPASAEPPTQPVAQETPAEVETATSTPDAYSGMPSTSDLHISFRVKYVAQGAVYLEGGHSAGLAEGMKLVVRDDGVVAPANPIIGVDPREIAELEVVSVAESSAVTDIKSSKRDVRVGDLAWLSGADEAALVQKRTLSATRKYPIVVTFTEGDPMEEEVRAEVPRPPLPEINRARGRIGIDYSSLVSSSGSNVSSSQLGLVLRTDITRIGGTYWNLSGYWRGRLDSRSSTSQPTLQDLINRTYHMSMVYDNPHSAWIMGLGRMYLPWATSLDTIDGGYVGRRLKPGVVAGAFGGSTPDPTSWSYQQGRRIAGGFVNFEGGSFDGMHYFSTAGGAASSVNGQFDRPFVFFENSLFYKRYFSLYSSVQADRPPSNPAVVSTGPGLARSFLTLRFQPYERLGFDVSHNYFRDVPTFDPALVGTGLLDKFLFQGLSFGVRAEVVRHVTFYTSLGQSSRSGEAKKSLNQLYGVTWANIWRTGLRADGHYSRFNSSFGNGSYESFSLSRNLTEASRIEIQAGRQLFSSSTTAPNSSRFLNAVFDTNLAGHYFLQGGFTLDRGDVQNYNQWNFGIGYRFDSREKRR
jgi:hypothetical protein